MENFLKSDEFARYRQLQLTCFAEFMAARMFGDEQDLREIKGGMEVIRQIVGLPLKIRKNDFTQMMTAQDLKTFEAKWIKYGLEQPDLDNE